MGYAISWLAVKGKSPDAFLNERGLRRTGEREEIPESPIVGAELPTGWFLVFYNRLVNDADLKAVSSGCEVVTCDVEEHVMYSGSAKWCNGFQTWSVIHDSNEGLNHLDAKGELPFEFAKIRKDSELELERAGERRTEVDYIFDIPIELAKLGTGFQYDMDIEGTDEDPFEVLERTRPRPARFSIFIRKLFAALGFGRSKA